MVQDVLKFMLQTGRFRDSNGTISEAREEAAKAFLANDWNEMMANAEAGERIEIEDRVAYRANAGAATDRFGVPAGDDALTMLAAFARRDASRSFCRSSSSRSLATRRASLRV